MEFFWAVVLIAILIVLSGVYVWRQVQTLGWLRTQESMASEDVSYYRWRSYRRLFGCLLTVVLAAMFIGLFAFGIMQELDRLVELGQQPKEVRGELSEEDERFVATGLRYVGTIGGGCCYHGAEWSPDGRYVFFAYQDLLQGESSETVFYFVPFATLNGGGQLVPMNFEPLADPGDLIEAAFRPAAAP